MISVAEAPKKRVGAAGALARLPPCPLILLDKRHKLFRTMDEGLASLLFLIVNVET